MLGAYDGRTHKTSRCRRHDDWAAVFVKQPHIKIPISLSSGTHRVRQRRNVWHLDFVSVGYETTVKSKTMTSWWSSWGIHQSLHAPICRQILLHRHPTGRKGLLSCWCVTGTNVEWSLRLSLRRWWWWKKCRQKLIVTDQELLCAHCAKLLVMGTNQFFGKLRLNSVTYGRSRFFLRESYRNS